MGGNVKSENTTSDKRYGVWSQPKDGSENGIWDTLGYPTKEYCEAKVIKWNREYPLLNHEVRERFHEVKEIS